jgi:hypothetical protein
LIQNPKEYAKLRGAFPMTDVEIFHANPHSKLLSSSDEQPNAFDDPRSGSSYDISSERRCGGENAINNNNRRNDNGETESMIWWCFLVWYLRLSHLSVEFRW